MTLGAKTMNTQSRTKEPMLCELSPFPVFPSLFLTLSTLYPKKEGLWIPNAEKRDAF